MQLKIANFFSVVQRAETGQRGYVLTGKDRYLDDYASARKALSDSFQSLRQSTKDNRLQQERLASLEAIVGAKMAELEETIVARRETGFEAALEIVIADRGKDLMDGIRGAVQEMTADEEHLLAVRSEEADQSKHFSTLCTFTGIGLIVATGILMIFRMNRNILAETQATQQIQDTMALLQSVLDSTDYTIIATDGEGTITVFNRGAERALGYRAEEVVGRTSLAAFHDQDEVAARTREMSDKLGRTIAPGFETLVANVTQWGHEETEWAYVRKNGSRFPVLLSIAAIRDGFGMVTGFLGIAQDIAASKAARNELQESERRFQQLADNIDDIFWITSIDGREMIYISPAYEKIFGRSCDSLYSRPTEWLDSVHPDDRQRVAQAFFEGGPRGEFDEQYRVLHPDGKIRWVYARGSVVLNAAGEAYRMAGIAQDISARKHYEEALHGSKERAEAGSRAKSQFLASMSHELRTPLNGVIGMIELLMGTRLDDRQRRFAEACKTSARSLLDLINDVLDFSKIEAGKIVLESQDFELGQVVEDAVRMVGIRAQDKGLELICSMDTNACRTVCGDSTRLRQVLVNLLNNALKFTPAGEVLVKVKLESLVDGQATVRFDIVDTGIGISVDRVQQLFSPFVQADSSTSRRFGGTGLGLAICKSLVEAMGGQVGVESREGIGSTFWFTARFECLAVPTRQSIVPSDLRLHVLVASKSLVLAGSLHELLSAWGMSAVVCSTGAEALAKLRHAASSPAAFELAIVDQQLADTSGLELASTIAGDSTLQSPRVFMLASVADAIDGLRSIDRRLNKPVCQSELLNAIVDCFCSTSAILPKPVAAITSGTAPRSAHAGSARILLAEDNRINQMFAEELLQQAGLACDCVGDGALAVAAVQARHYDLILMDCHMPDVDGFEATRRIRQLEREGLPANQIPIVALTANAIKGDREYCLAAGMNDYLSKPFEAKPLVTLIDRLLSSRADLSIDGQPRAQDPSAEANAPIDAAALLARCLGNAAFAGSILDEFERTAIDSVEKISRHAADRDPRGAAQAAHALKGAAGLVAAEAVQSVAGHIEAAGKSDDVEQVVVLIDELRREMRKCLAFVPTARNQATRTIQ